MPLQKIRDGEITLYYDEYGTGEKYILCAQEMHFKEKTYQIQLAERGFHVYNITIRGYRESTHVFEDLGDKWYDIWAEDTVEFAKAKGIKKFLYTGHSHGGGIGWHIALNYPGMMEGFVSICGGPHPKNGEQTDTISKFSRGATIAAAKAGMDVYREHIHQAALYYATPLTGDETPEEAAKIRAANQEWEDYFASYTYEEAVIDPRKPFSWCNTEEELIEELSKLTIPTLHLAGLHDEIVPAEYSLRSARAVKDSKLVLYGDAHHGVPEQKLNDVVNEIILFCNDKHLFQGR